MDWEKMLLIVGGVICYWLFVIGVIRWSLVVIRWSFGDFGAGGEFAYHVLGHGGKDLFAGFVFFLVAGSKIQ